MTKTPQRKKKIKAWIITDGSSNPLVLGAMGDKSTDRIFFVYMNEKEAKRVWSGFKIYPCEITYKI